MIVKMKKVTLLTLKKEKEKTLKALRKLGVVHVVNIQIPSSDDLSFVHSQMDDARALVQVLKEAKEPPEKTVTNLTAEEAIKKFDEISEKKADLQKKLAGYEKQAQDIIPFGEFDVSLIKKLSDKGLIVKLYEFPANQLPEIPENINAFEIASTKSSLYYALISDDEKIEIADYQPITIPDKNLSELKKAMDKCSDDIEENDISIAAMKPLIPVLEEYINNLEAEAELLAVRDGMGEDKVVSYLEGFIPEDETEPLEHAAHRCGWGLAFSEVSEDDNVPTLLTNPTWVKPMKTVFNAIGILPGYDEIDFSSVFLCFFSVFVGIIVGDAGYGLIFLAITLMLAKKIKKAQPAALGLLFIMDFATIIWGAISCNYFGIQPQFMPHFLREINITWLAGGDGNNMMKLCFFIGAVHLTIAHLWKICKTINSTLFLADIGWIGMTWTMYLAARMVVLNETEAMPSWWLLCVSLPSLVLAIVFMTTKEKLKEDWPNFVIMPLTVINNFVDVVSYVRLYAVGTASLAIAVAFNEMAMQSVHADGSLPKVIIGLIAALILFAGHSLNIILAGMGILVHGIRLNTLEFSGHIGVEWKGHEYKPFAEKK